MSKLKITQGEWKVRTRSTKNNQYIETVLQPYPNRPDAVYIMYSYQLSDDECLAENCCTSDKKSNATLIADAGTTYNQCGLLPSRLLEQKESLLDEKACLGKSLEDEREKNRELLSQNEELKEALKKAMPLIEGGHIHYEIEDLLTKYQTK